MNTELTADWVDRFTAWLSRHQRGASPDVLVDRAFARRWTLGDVPPEVAAQIEYSESVGTALNPSFAPTANASARGRLTGLEAESAGA